MALATASFDEILDDLSSRFIINVPEEELASVERICFQIEQAHWFYEDFVREQRGDLPSFSLKNFSAKFFQHCPLLHQWANEHERAFADFMQYKIRVPVCGAIILNEGLDKCLLVKGWSSRSGWGFPKGKINKDEPDSTCAAREVFEETGYDISSGLKEEDFIELTMREQRIRLYIIAGVSEDVDFSPQTRKEISQISWHKLNELPTYRIDKRTHGHVLAGYKSDPEGGRFQYRAGMRNGGDSGVCSTKFNGSRFYMVVPFVGKLRQWVHTHRKTKRRSSDAGALINGHHKSELARAMPIHADVETPQRKGAATPNNAPVTPAVTSTQPQQLEPQPTTNKSSEILKSILGIGVTARPISSTNEQTSQQPQQSMAPALQQLFIQQQQQHNQHLPQPQSQPASRPPLKSPFGTPPQHFVYYPPYHPPLHHPQTYPPDPTTDDRARKTSLLNLLHQTPSPSSTSSPSTNDLDMRTKQLKRSSLLDALYANVVATSPAPVISHSSRGYAMPPAPNVPGYTYGNPGMGRQRTHSLPFPYMDDASSGISPMARSKHAPVSTSPSLWPVPQSPTRATMGATPPPIPHTPVPQQQYQDANRERLRKISLLGVLSASSSATTTTPSSIDRSRVVSPPPTSLNRLPSRPSSAAPVLVTSRKISGGSLVSAGEGELLLQRLLNDSGNGSSAGKPSVLLNGTRVGHENDTTVNDATASMVGPSSVASAPAPVPSASSEVLKGLLGIASLNSGTIASTTSAPLENGRISLPKHEGGAPEENTATDNDKGNSNSLTGFKFDVDKIVGCLG
ncbi:Dcp2, box A domain-containing protein [Jimgerdemannia flammicorona]|uniref:Dcp2, box A domain-containing protein n=1 Tax=Jimgerdemannia flammicorona TaxID=994334 RepID=A0A433DE74_9FUNG|nr:Dcp2, box A domain-containing protein [Jimgerdemannia flammicorona]